MYEAKTTVDLHNPYQPDILACYIIVKRVFKKGNKITLFRTNESECNEFEGISV